MDPYFSLFPGLYLYVLVVQTFMAENIRLRIYAAIGWGESQSIPYFLPSDRQISFANLLSPFPFSIEVVPH